MRRNSSRRRRKRRKEAYLPTAGIGAPPLPPCANTQQRPVIKESESEETLLAWALAFSGMRNLLPRQPSSSSRFLRRPPGKISTTWRWLADGGEESHRSQKKTRMLFFPLYAWFVAAAAEGPPPHQKLPPRACAYISLSLSSLLGLTLSNRPGASSSIFAATVGPPSPPPPPPFNSAVRQGKPSEADTSRSGRERERESQFSGPHMQRSREKHTWA